jgi:hypothetical protein
MLNLLVATRPPLGRMLHHARAHHVEVDVNQTTGQMDAAVDRGGVVAIFPKHAPAALAGIELLARAPGDELQAANDLVTALVTDEQDWDVVWICGSATIESTNPHHVPPWFLWHA